MPSFDAPRGMPHNRRSAACMGRGAWNEDLAVLLSEGEQDGGKRNLNDLFFRALFFWENQPIIDVDHFAL
ncbi:hypothetical protein U14_03570 [Candidatus Moduliflexus flocculans]|uniref:Uncharacterized protein n=1 Tax=Candidatus Moduliflexus flocculans TaxID=1499966 RepID=A0A081BPK3_9BACT|nr:hypothetical protein U14_03570 [Candidatus Moduliflexus flocculans]